MVAAKARQIMDLDATELRRTKNMRMAKANNVELVDKKLVIDTIHKYFLDKINSTKAVKTEDGEIYDVNIVEPMLEDNKSLSKLINALSPAERTGHWMNIEHHDGHAYGECSECLHVRIATEFCSACGADMRGEE